MKAVYVEQFGDIDAMQLTDVPEPRPGPGQVLVRVHASGINYAETRMRSGAYIGVDAPLVLGMESAGVVEAVGSDVTGFKPGDRVFGRARGSHAELVVAWARDLMPLPDELSFVEGAAVPVGWLTAWHALVTVAAAEPGERVLIEAVASSVGSAALQIGKWRGCWVAGTASRDAKLEAARQWGADAVYNYKDSNVADAIARDTSGGGVDIALVTIGEETAESTVASMGYEGRLVMYGSTGGRQFCFSLNAGERNLAFLTMSITSSRRFYSETMSSFRDQAVPLLANGTFRPVVDTVLPLPQVADAHRMVGERNHFGKIVMQVA